MVDPDDDEEDYDLDEEDADNSDDEYDGEGRSSGKRQSLGDGDSTSRAKRRRVDREVRSLVSCSEHPCPKIVPQSRRKRRDEYHEYHDRVGKHYGGTHHGQSAAGIIYILATVLERVDNDLLWCV